MAKDKLRVGVIGLGMGGAHIKGYREHPNAEVVAVCDIVEQRLKDHPEAAKIKGKYVNYQEMFDKEKLDVVSVAVPNFLHAKLTIAGLEAGCHVLCEKPMAMSAKEAQAMQARADELGKRLMINFSFRFNPMSYALKSQVDAGVLGDVYFARTVWLRRRGIPGLGGWFVDKARSGGGPLIDLGVHRLDLALWLMGYPEPEVVVGSSYDHLGIEIAKREKKDFSVEDLAAGFVKFSNKASLAIEASWALNSQERECMGTWLYGTKGGLVQRNVDEGYQFEAWLFTEENGFHFNKKLAMENRPVPTAMHHFIESILNGTPHIATGEDGVKVMKILDGIYKSAKTGKPVNVK